MISAERHHWKGCSKLGRGSSGVVEAPPRIVAEPAQDDRRLVAAARRGDDRAFEALYARYHRRIQAYVLGMVKDHGRAEDVTQEVFVSALRRMRETERPIAFKPWIYEIAKNACIDQFRRSRRAEEVSLEADGGLAPGDYGKLVGSDPTPDAAVAAKQDLDHLCGAFGGLSDTHHEILVLRELEGLSYREIGERMGMSRPAVESTLFRARRRLAEEYDDLVSGARCRRIEGLIAMAADGSLGRRESRRLSRHVAHCQPCRREAIAAGLDAAILTHVPLPKRAARRIASLLPFHLLGRARGGADLPMLSDQLSGGWGKLATAAAVLVAGAGAAGVGTKAGGDDGAARGDGPAALPRGGAAQAAAPAAARTTRRAAAVGPRREPAATKRRARRPRRGRDGGGSGPAATTQPAGAAGRDAPATGAGTGKGINLPAVGGEPARPVTETVERVADPVVKGATETVKGATGPVVNGATDTVQSATDTVQGTTDAVQGATGTDQGPVGGVVDGVQDTVGGASGGVLP